MADEVAATVNSGQNVASQRGTDHSLKVIASQTQSKTSPSMEEGTLGLNNNLDRTFKSSSSTSITSTPPDETVTDGAQQDNRKVDFEMHDDTFSFLIVLLDSTKKKTDRDSSNAHVDSPNLNAGGASHKAEGSFCCKFTDKLPVFTSLAIISLKIVLFILLGLNLVDMEAESNKLGIPASVPGPVVISQFLAMAMAVFTQNDVVWSIILGVQLVLDTAQLKRLGKALPPNFTVVSSWYLAAIPIIFCFLVGVLGLAITLMLVVNSGTVLDVLLNFAAATFVADLDESAFFLAQKGFFGVKHKQLAEIISKIVNGEDLTTTGAQQDSPTEENDVSHSAKSTQSVPNTEDARSEVGAKECPEDMPKETMASIGGEEKHGTDHKTITVKEKDKPEEAKPVTDRKATTGQGKSKSAAAAKGRRSAETAAHFSSFLRFCVKLILLVVMFICWAVVYKRQREGRYAPKTIIVQFDDEVQSRLGYHSGFYKLDHKRSFNAEKRFRYHEVRSGNEKFRYCGEEGYWAFHIGGDDVTACNKTTALLQSSSLYSFNILDYASEPWFVKRTDSGSTIPMDGFLMVIGCENDADCNGGTCVDNRCDCDGEDNLLGPQCEFVQAEACSDLALSQLYAPSFQTTRTFSSRFHRVEDKAIYNRPVYWNAEFDDKNETDVIFFTGLRWALTKATEERLDQYTENRFQSFDLTGIDMMSEPVRYRSPDDGSPINLRWVDNLYREKNIAEAVLSDAGLTASLLCSKCNNTTNLCAFNNTCSADGKCNCPNGERGELCEDAPVSDGKCDVAFNKIEYSYDGGDCCHPEAIGSCAHNGTCNDNFECVCAHRATGKFCNVPPVSDGTCDPYFNTAKYNYDGGDCCHVNATGVRSCANEGTCSADGDCTCVHGASGKFCDIPPLSDGKCDPYFNNIDNDFDGGDCCRQTCTWNTCGQQYQGERYVDVALDIEEFMTCKDPRVRKQCKPEKPCYIEDSEVVQYHIHSPFPIFASDGRTILVVDQVLSTMDVYDLTSFGNWERRGRSIPLRDQLADGGHARLNGVAMAFAQPPLPYIEGRESPLPEFLVFVEPNWDFLFQVRSWDEFNQEWSDPINFMVPETELKSDDAVVKLDVSIGYTNDNDIIADSGAMGSYNLGIMLFLEGNLYKSKSRAFANDWQNTMEVVDENVKTASIMMGTNQCDGGGEQCTTETLAYWKNNDGLIVKRKNGENLVANPKIDTFSAEAMKLYRLDNRDKLNESGATRRDRLLLVLSRNVVGCKKEILIETFDIPAAGSLLTLSVTDSFRYTLEEGETLLRVDIPGPRTVGLVLVNKDICKGQRVHGNDRGTKVTYRTFIADSNGAWPNEIALQWRQVPDDLTFNVRDVAKGYVPNVNGLVTDIVRDAHHIPVSWSGDGSYIAVGRWQQDPIVYKLDNRCGSIDSATLRLTMKTKKYAGRFRIEVTGGEDGNVYYKCNGCIGVSDGGNPHSLLMDEICIPRKDIVKLTVKAYDDDSGSNALDEVEALLFDDDVVTIIDVRVW